MHYFGYDKCWSMGTRLSCRGPSKIEIGKLFTTRSLRAENTRRSSSGRKTLKKSLQGSFSGSTTAPAVSRMTYNLKAPIYPRIPSEAFRGPTTRQMRSNPRKCARSTDSARHALRGPFGFAPRLSGPLCKKTDSEFKVYPAPE